MPKRDVVGGVIFWWLSIGIVSWRSFEKTNFVKRADLNAAWFTWMLLKSFLLSKELRSLKFWISGWIWDNTHWWMHSYLEIGDGNCESASEEYDCFLLSLEITHFKYWIFFEINSSQNFIAMDSSHFILSSGYVPRLRAAGTLAVLWCRPFSPNWLPSSSISTGRSICAVRYWKKVRPEYWNREEPIMNLIGPFLAARGSFRRKNAWCSTAVFHNRFASWGFKRAKPTTASTGSVCGKQC